VDGFHPRHETRIGAVQTILKELGYDRIPRLLVFNKTDLLDEGRLHELLVGRDAVPISATKGTGIDSLLSRIDGLLPPRAAGRNGPRA
jgi:GTP-binding protein HflX